MNTLLSVLISALLPVSAWASDPSKDMAAILNHYLSIQNQLSQDSTQLIAKKAKEIHAVSLSLEKLKKNSNKKLLTDIRVASEKLAKQTTLEGMRTAFKALSKPMVVWAKASKPEGVTAFTCSMVKADWLQRETEASNPFYGTKMKKCGERVHWGEKHKMPHSHDSL